MLVGDQMEDLVKAFIETRLDGQAIPNDLGALLAAISNNPGFEASDDNPLSKIWAELINRVILPS